MSEPDPLAAVRFFVDENLAGLGLALRRVRPTPDLVVASHPPIADLVPRDDPDWIPDVARRGWVVITNDRRIRTRPTEAPRAVEHGLLVVHLDAGRRPRVWDHLRLLLRHWDDVEAMHALPGPIWLELDVRRMRSFTKVFEPGKRLGWTPTRERIVSGGHAPNVVGDRPVRRVGVGVTTTRNRASWTWESPMTRRASTGRPSRCGP